MKKLFFIIALAAALVGCEPTQYGKRKAVERELELEVARIKRDLHLHIAQHNAGLITREQLLDSIAVIEQRKTRAVFILDSLNATHH